MAGDAQMQSFPVGDLTGLRAFLAAAPRAVVFFRGTHCPYSATLRPHVEAAAAAGLPGWTFAVQDLSETGDDPTWDACGVEVTPTVVAYERGREVSRVAGRMLLGITRSALQKWLRTLPA